MPRAVAIRAFPLSNSAAAAAHPRVSSLGAAGAAPTEGSGDDVLEVLAFEPDSRWVSRSQVGPFSLEMTAVIEPAEEAASRLTLIVDTRARGAMRYVLPVLAPRLSLRGW